MATFNGSIVPSSFVHDAGSDISVNISAFDNPFVIGELGAITSAPIFGAPTGDGVLEQISVESPGMICPSVRDTFYNRIWVIPQRTDFGNLTSEQVISIEVWNAYEDTKLLSGITTEGQTDGTVLTGPASGNFDPFESVIYSLQVTTFGSPFFDGRYIWNFPDGESPYSRVTGKRVIPFAFKHNWASEVLERVGYLTPVLRAFTGKEQRYGIRKHPRRTLEYSHLVNGNQRQRFENLLVGWQQRTFALPIWTDRQRLTSQLTAGATSLTISTLYRDFEDDGLVLLWKSDTQYELVEIDSLTSTTLNFKSATLQTWPIGTSVVPIRLAEAGAKSSWTRTTEGFSQMRIAWQLRAGQPISNRLKTPTLETYKSVEVWYPKNNWSDGQPITQDVGVTSLDFGYGPRLTIPQEEAPYQTPEITLLIEGRDKIAEFWSYLDRRKGSRIGVWYEQRSRDFTLKQDVASNGNVLRVEGANYTQYAFPFEHRRDITIWTSSTTKYRRRITGSTVDIDGTELISIDSSLGVALTAASKPVISYLRYVRLEADENEVAWITDDTIQVKVRVKELLNVPA